MKRTVSTLITFLFLAALSVNPAMAKKHRHGHKKHEQEQLPEKLLTFNTDSLSADSVISFAKTLLNTPYRPASSNPATGFDCSGYVSYVFRNFNVNVPRSSCEYSNAGESISISDAKPGDVILFTGTKSHHPHSIGHVGIVFSNDGNQLSFIHSTSGKEYCVTITAMDDTYKRRFVKVVRLLKQNNNSILACR